MIDGLLEITKNTIKSNQIDREMKKKNQMLLQTTAFFFKSTKRTKQKH